jgi:probable addiction module antidote protein
MTAPYDPVANLSSEERIIALLDAALEDGDPQVIATILGNIARARGMTQLSRETGLAREALYRALSAEADPKLGTILKVIQALAIKLHSTIC